MAIRIGHASIDENGKANSGVAGDQTKKEVVIRDWYNKPWNVVLRPKSATVAELSAKACEAACENDNVGYDQYARNTLNTKAKAVGYDIAAISDPCECDCSSLMHVCAIAGGAALTYGSNGHTTRTMVKEFVNSGDYEKLTDSKYLSSDKYLKRGDILVKEGSHTAMALDNGSEIVAPAPVVTLPLEDNATTYYSVRLPVLHRGMVRESVKAMQLLLVAHGFNSPILGNFNERTEAALVEFQTEFNLKVTGKCDADTWSALLGLTGVG